MKLTLKICFKYAFSKYKAQRTTNILIIIGLSLGLAALIVISGMMNNLQNFQIKGLKNIQSFDISVKSASLSAEDIKKIKGVETAFEFLDTAVLVSNKKNGRNIGLRIRGLNLDDIKNTRMMDDIKITNDFSSINLSYTLYSILDASYLSELSVTFLNDGNTMRIKADTKNLYVSGFYTSSVSEFNRNTAFMDLSSLKHIIGEKDLKIGVFINGELNKVESEIKLLDPNAEIINWKKANNAVYSALLLEKITMYVFLGFIFIIISVSLKNSTTRLIRNKSKETAMLRALGLKKNKVVQIFLEQGLIILILGEIFGLILGIIIQSNIQTILNIIDFIIRSLTGTGTILGSFPFTTNLNAVEIIISCIIIFFIGTFFIIRSCKKLNKYEIMEIILNAST